MRRILPALVAASLLVAPACGDDDDETSTGDAACEARDQLGASVDALRDVNVVEGGTDAVQTAIADVDDSLQEVSETTSADLEDEVDAIRSAVDGVEDAASSVGDGGTPASAVEEVTAAVAVLASAVGDLGDALRDECG